MVNKNYYLEVEFQATNLNEAIKIQNEINLQFGEFIISDCIKRYK